MITFSFIKPYDVFMPRGNSHFGVTSGDFGQIRMLPAPSLFAGAFRSMLAAKKPADLFEIENGRKPKSSAMAESLGSISEPGSFRVAMLALAKVENGKHFMFFPMPADLVVFGERNKNKNSLVIAKIRPEAKPAALNCPSPLPLMPILKAPLQKPSGGLWLNEAGFKSYLEGNIPASSDLVSEKDFWIKEIRVGITLDGQTRSAADGMLYSAEVISFGENIGFIAGLQGVDETLPEKGELRLGGDARAAHFTRIKFKVPETSIGRIKESKAFRLVLASPGIFAEGWLPDGVSRRESEFYLEKPGFSARLACATLNGNDIVSGWDMFAGKPKEAQRVVPAGSVYWFDKLEGDADALVSFIQNGLWGKTPDRQRVAEGFNQAFLASYDLR